MIGSLVLKCILLAKFQVEVVTIPVEYENAIMTKVHNGISFEANVMEGKISSLIIENPGVAKTMSMSSSVLDSQKSMSINLNMINEYASMDCDLNQISVK